MLALDRSPAAFERPACVECRHARGSARDGLYCARRAGLPYPCEVERGSALVEAWLYDACGRRARFFEPKAAASSEQGTSGSAGLRGDAPNRKAAARG